MHDSKFSKRSITPGTNSKRLKLARLEKENFSDPDTGEIDEEEEETK